MASPDELVRWDIVEEHLDEAEFLFAQWDEALDSQRVFDRVGTGVESRLLAHVDGLAVGGAPVADRLLWSALAPDAEEMHRVAAATLALVLWSDAAALERVLAVLAKLEPGVARAGIVHALVSSAGAQQVARLVGTAERGDDAVRLALLPVFAARGGFGAGALLGWIDRLPSSDDRSTREAGARAAMFCPRASALRVAERLVNDPDRAVATAALRTAIIHGSGGAYLHAFDIVRGKVRADVGVRRAAMECLASCGEPPAVAVLLDRLGDTESQADAIWALGFSGRVETIDPLSSLLEDEQLGPLAAEAIVGITGIGRDDPGFWIDAPIEPGPTGPEIAEPIPSEDLDVALDPTAEESLPVPRAGAFLAAWAQLRPRFDSRLRFHMGRALGDGSAYVEALASSTMRRRHNIALELAIRTRGVCVLGTRTMTRLQRAQLGTVAALGAIDGARAFARIS